MKADAKIFDDLQLVIETKCNHEIFFLPMEVPHNCSLIHPKATQKRTTPHSLMRILSQSLNNGVCRLLNVDTFRRSVDYRVAQLIQKF